MLTQKEHQMLETYWYLIATTKLYPFVWTKHKFIKLRNSKTFLQKLGTYLQLLISCSHAAYLGIRFIPGYGYTSEDFKVIHFSMIAHAINLGPTLTGLTMQILAFVKPKELADLSNQLFYFNIENGNAYDGIL